MSYFKTRFGGAPRMASATALLASSAAATFTAGVAAAVVRFSLGGPVSPRPGVRPLPDGTWGAAWEATIARPADVFPAEALAVLARALGQVATAALIIAALSILLHAVSRILADWRSLAVRCALGARLRHLLALAGLDLLVLCMVGCGTGLVGAGLALTILRASWPALLTHPAIGAAVAGAALGGTTAVAALVGSVALGLLAPLQRGGVRAIADLHGDHVTTPGGRLQLQNAVVVVQLAGLLVAAYSTVLILRDGPRARGGAALHYPDSLAVVPLVWDNPVWGGAAERARGYRRLLAAMDRAGVEAALTSPDAWVGLGKELPLLAFCGNCFESMLLKPINSATVRAVAAAPNALKQMGVGVRGRDLASRDTLGATRVTVLSEVAARQLFPGANPIGLDVRTGLDSADTYTVVGVARSLAPRGLGATSRPLPMAYFSLLQHPPVVAETTLRADDVGRLERAVARGFGRTRAGPRLGAPTPLRARLAEFGAPLAWFGGIITALTVAAALLGILGLAAVMSQVVTLRRRDISIRLAIGALPRHVELWLLGKALRLTGVGVLLGLSGARWVGWLMREETARALESDFAVLCLLAACFAPIGLVACWLPARRAARVQPATVWSEPRN